jgi:hypothetical protein
MSVYRIYPEKSNTIASGTLFQHLNSGQNAVSELWYGGGGDNTYPQLRNSISRLLLYFDLSTLQNKINTKEINGEYVQNYKLCLKNAIPSDKVLESEYKLNVLSKKIAASFDLICFPINKDWEEGRGYDLVEEKYLVKQNGNPLISGTSNWIYATDTIAWDEPGVYTDPTATTTFYSSQHFDIGNEDIEFDVTDIVKNWLSGGSENYGIAISYRRDYELISGDVRYISAFFTENTNTSFKPYIQVNYNQSIMDDRKQVSNNRPSNLFLYTFSGHNPVNIYNLSAVTVDIKKNGTNIYTGLTPTHLSKGVYFVNVWMSGATAGEIYKDYWNNVSFSIYDNQNIEQTFQVQKNFYTNSIPSINEYVLDYYGLDNNCTIRQDENIRVFCDLRENYSTEAPSHSYDLEYQMIMNQHTQIIPWTSMNQQIYNNCKTNYFDIDSSWLLHNQNYEIFFRIKEMGTSRVMPSSLKFNVIKPF